MAAKIKLDLDPQEQLTFERAVKIPTPDGKPLVVTFTFKHRTRAEMAEFTEKQVAIARQQYAELQEQIKAEEAAQAEAKERGEAYTPPAPKLSEGVPAAIENDIDAVMDLATGWNLEHEFNRENLAKFFGLYAKAAYTIANDYRVSLNEGRLGN